MPKGKGYGMKKDMVKKGMKKGKAMQTGEMKKKRMGLSSMTTSASKMKGKKMGK